MFDARISRTTAVLGPTIDAYKNSRKELLENIQHCTDDTGLTDAINDDNIGTIYNDLQGKYDGYKLEFEGMYKNTIHNFVRTIIDTHIDQLPHDQLPQQNATRTIFQKLRYNCIAFAGFITEHMQTLEDDVKDFNAAVTDYVKNKIPNLTKKLIVCIIRSIDDAKTKIDNGYGAIHSKIIDDHFVTGNRYIVEIPNLLDELDELDKLEAAGP